MGTVLAKVVIYPPPLDGLPHVVVVIVNDDPQLVGFDTTLEQATATAQTTLKRLSREYEFEVS